VDRGIRRTARNRRPMSQCRARLHRALPGISSTPAAGRGAAVIASPGSRSGTRRMGISAFGLVHLRRKYLHSV
jgi:hypothetical protein